VKNSGMFYGPHSIHQFNQYDIYTGYNLLHNHSQKALFWPSLLCC